jgi:hypothetical protein
MAMLAMMMMMMIVMHKPATLVRPLWFGQPTGQIYV